VGEAVLHPIALYRRAKGWGQKELARELGVSLGAVQGWERGAKPRPAAFKRLAQVLGVDPLRLARESQRWEQGGGKKR